MKIANEPKDQPGPMAQDGRINWKTTKEDACLIDEIVRKAQVMELGCAADGQRLEMDLIACHLNGTPLLLNDLLGAHDIDFVHDLAGIARHLNRSTGKLENCFLPRYAKPRAVSA